MNDSATATAQPSLSFAEATEWDAVSPNRFRGSVDPGWGHGRSVFGGVVGAGLVRAMAQDVPDDKLLRSLTVSFVGPVEPAALECTTEIVRDGKSATFVTGSVVQDGTKRTIASATFARARHSTVSVPGPARPEAPDPDSLPVMPYLEGVMPRFTQWLDFRYTRGTYPFMGNDTPAIAGWCRFRDDAQPGDAAGMVGLIDAWPSPALSAYRAPAPGSSITWNVDFAGTRPDVRVDEWWYFEAEASFIGEGYNSFDASLWAPDGQFAARSRQLAGVFERPPAG
ncbi:MAG: thioesterase family protein [Myxococcota bacterium]